MYKQGTSTTRCVKNATIVDQAHHIRRRMRDLREPEAAEQETTPRFLLFRKLGPPRWKTTERGAAFWFVLGAWLLFAALICAAVIVALHWKK
jgi:hypothetical protein